MTTRWPRSARPERPMPPPAEVDAAVAAGDFGAWCRERGVDPIDALRHAAQAKISALREVSA